MSAIANRRKLAEAAQALVKTNRPEMAHYEAVATALAQVFTDDTCINCQCILRWDGSAAEAQQRKDRP